MSGLRSGGMLALRHAEKHSRLPTFVVAATGCALIVGGLVGSASAISNLPQTSSTAIVVDGAVNAVVTTGSTVVLGGSFTHAGSYTGGFAAAPVGGGTPASRPAINGAADAVVPDGSGGWYVGGSFTRVGTASIANLAHLTSSGSVDTSWNPAPSAQVNALALSSNGQTLYGGGAFTTIGGTTCNELAALTASSGAVTAWNPNADGAVKALTLSPDGSILYAAGAFATIDGPRSRAVTIVVKARLEGVPAKIPAWASRLSLWQSKARSTRGKEPAAPTPLPSWYAPWRRWTESRLSLKP